MRRAPEHRRRGAGEPDVERRRAGRDLRLERGVAGLPISELALRYVDGEPEIVGYSDGGGLSLQLGWGEWSEKLEALSRVVTHEKTREDGPRKATSLAGEVDVRDPRVVAARWRSAPGSA